MAFMTIKTIVFQNLKKKFFNFAILFFLCFFLLPNLVSLLQVKYNIMGVKGIRGIGVPKSFKEFVMTLLASTPVFHKKKSKLM